MFHYKSHKYHSWHSLIYTKQLLLLGNDIDLLYHNHNYHINQNL